MRVRFAALLSACALTGATTPLMAQGAQDTIAPPVNSAQRAALLQDLADTLGGVHYLTVACDGRGAQYWRERMIALVEAESETDPYVRNAMIGAFNAGYQERERIWPSCSAEARAARREAAHHGGALSEALSRPYR